MSGLIWQALRERRTVVTCEPQSLTGVSLSETVDALAAEIAAIGVKPRQRVVLVTENSLESVAALLALMQLDASSVLIDPRSSASEVTEIARRIEASAIVASQGSRGMAGEGTAPTEVLGLRGLINELWVRRTERTEAVCEEGELTVQCTSGVSGRPKLVARTTSHLENELRSLAQALALDDGAATVCPCPVFHTYGLVNGLLLPLYCGRPTVLLDWFLPTLAWDAIARHRAEVFVGVPAMYEALCRSGGGERAAETLRFCLSAGAPLGERTQQAFVQAFRADLHQQYGATEMGAVALNLLDGAQPSPLTVGRPLPGRSLKIVRDDGGAAGPEEPGEIAVRSGGSAERYLDDRAGSAERFRGAWYFTGDLGRIDEAGNVTIIGRRSSFINVGGEKVDPDEVERVLSGFDAVAECVVIPRRDLMAGQVVEAVVVRARDTSSQEVRRYCRQRLPSHKVPRHVRFVDALPKSATGKILRKALLQ